MLHTTPIYAINSNIIRFDKLGELVFTARLGKYFLAEGNNT